MKCRYSLYQGEPVYIENSYIFLSPTEVIVSRPRINVRSIASLLSENKLGTLEPGSQLPGPSLSC